MKLMFSSPDSKVSCIFHFFVELISLLGGNRSMVFVLILTTTRCVHCLTLIFHII